VDAVRAALARGIDEGRYVEVAVGGGCRTDVHRSIGGDDVRRACVGVRVHGYALDAQLTARADDSERDLAAVRDEQPFDHFDQVGLRFSRKARRPSWPSAEARRDASVRAVNAVVASPISRFLTSRINDFATAIASGAPA